MFRVVGLHNGCRRTGELARVGEPDDRVLAETAEGLREPEAGRSGEEGSSPGMGTRVRNPSTTKARGPGETTRHHGPRHIRTQKRDAIELAEPTTEVRCEQRNRHTKHNRGNSGAPEWNSQTFPRLFGGECSGLSGYIVVAAGREDLRGLGSPMTEFLPRRPRVLGSPRLVALAKEGVPPELGTRVRSPSTTKVRGAGTENPGPADRVTPGNTGRYHSLSGFAAVECSRFLGRFEAGACPNLPQRRSSSGSTANRSTKYQ